MSIANGCPLSNLDFMDEFSSILSLKIHNYYFMHVHSWNLDDLNAKTKIVYNLHFMHKIKA
jgi:hypothetical protein